MTSDDPFLHEYFSRFQASARSGDKPQTIGILMGSTAISGGTYVILQHAMYLQNQGMNVVLVPRTHDVADTWHPGLEALAVETIEVATEREYDLVIATWWPTVYDLPRFRTRHVAYLVQSVEGRFALASEEERAWVPAAAELTYTFDIPIITIARYLEFYLGLRHRRPAFLVRNGIRKDLYSAIGPTLDGAERSGLRVLVEGPVDIPMKNVEQAIRLARAGGAEEIWLLTSSDVDRVAGVDRVFSRVPIESVSTIYRSCDVLCKLSQVEGMYGPPLEMFHCGGTVITYDVTGHEEYVHNEVNGLVVPMGDQEAVVEAIRRLRDDPALLRSLRSQALVTAAKWPDWATSSAEFASIIRAMLRQPPRDNTALMLQIRGGSLDLV